MVGYKHMHDTDEVLERWVVALESMAAPIHRPVGEIETLFRVAFEATQAATHVITGSLKASGHTDTDVTEDSWTGRIIYGGPLFGAPAPGPPNDPVEYAIYEMARGGEHDFLAPAEAVFNDTALSKIVDFYNEL
jgi:hypothetical protein